MSERMNELTNEQTNLSVFAPNKLQWDKEEMGISAKAIRG
jgi:hypothetical protein